MVGRVYSTVLVYLIVYTHSIHPNRPNLIGTLTEIGAVSRNPALTYFCPLQTTSISEK